MPARILCRAPLRRERFEATKKKCGRFESIMGRDHREKHCGSRRKPMGDVNGATRISNRVIREMDEVLEEREEREEARYKKLDETIRNHQKARQEIAGDQGRRRTKEKPFLPEKTRERSESSDIVREFRKTDAGFL